MRSAELWDVNVMRRTQIRAYAVERPLRFSFHVLRRKTPPALK
jgi:hypothetical protein